MRALERLPAVSPATFRRITLATVVALVFITVTGAAVRLTGSGLGCSTWPSCEADSFTPRSASDLHGMIEFGNRLVTGLVGAVTLAAIYGAHSRIPRRRDLVSWSWQVLLWVAANALVGKIVVESDLLPATVIVHFALALAAIWSAVVLHHRAGEDGREPGAPPDPAVSPRLRRAGHVLLGVAMVVILVGTLVTGSGPHAGDEAADRLALDIDAVARVHGISALLLLTVALYVAWLAGREEAPLPIQDATRWLSLALVTQAFVGYAQYLGGLPPLLVGVHVLGSTLVWIAVLRVWLALRQPAPAPAPVEPRPGPRAPAPTG